MPTTLTGTGQKLRNSCDSCNLAKVKCSKGRPACDRCSAQGVQCIYGISMRAGKHRARGSNIQKSKPESPPSMSATKEGSPVPPFTNEGDTQTFDPTLTTMVNTLPMTADWSTMLTEDPYLLSTSMDLDSDTMKPHGFSSGYSGAELIPSSDDLSMDPSNIISNGNTALSDSPNSFSPDFSEDPSLTDSTFTSYSSSSTPHHDSDPTAPCSCNMRVLQQLLNLTKIPEVPSAYDTALNQNKQVINFCHSIIDDQSNHIHDISFVLTLTALIAKVIAVYDAIYNPYHHSRGRSTSLSSPFTTEHLASLHENSIDALPNSNIIELPSFSAPVTNATNSPFGSSTNLASLTSGRKPRSKYPMRLSLGTYHLDEKDEEKLKWDIFKIELSKVNALVSAFERKFCDEPATPGMGTHGDQMPTPQSKYEAKAYEDMVYYLQKRLRVSMEMPRETAV